MERVWRRVQGAGRRGTAVRCGCPIQPCQLHVDQRAKRGGGGRKSHGPQTIVCSCQVQPCPVHPVLIRVRRTRPSNMSCDCPPESQPCPHVIRPSSLRKVRRCDCTERPCRHSSSAGVSRRRPQGSFSLPAPPMPPRAHNPNNHEISCKCPERPNCSHLIDGTDGCECEAKPCVHTIKSRRTRRTCDCPSQPCSHSKSTEGRIKRVKCRVRRAGCAMARCTAELAMLRLHWELATECAPCKPRALTRRLCRRQQSDNELYRSNSFKFERFERTKDECSTPVRKQVSLCDDYSLPVDFVNKRRPASASALTSTVQWALPSPSIENAEIEVIEQYSDPRDSKSRAYVEPGAEATLPPIYSKINRDYCRPYTDPSESESSCDEELTGRLSYLRRPKTHSRASNSGKDSRLSRDNSTSNDGVTVDCVAVVHVHDQSPTDSNQPIRHPSPYYYGDLFKVPEQFSSNTQSNKYRKSVSLDVPGERSRTPGLPKRNSVAGDGGTAPFSTPPQLSQQQSHQPPTSEDLLNPAETVEHAAQSQTNEILSSCIITEWDHTLMPPHRLFSHDLPTTVCTCVASPDDDELESTNKVVRHQVRKLRRARRVDPQHPTLIEDKYDAEIERPGDEADSEEEEAADGEDEIEDDEMARQRHLYETAFDCKVNRSDNELDDVDRVTNHPVLHSQLRTSISQSRASSSTDTIKQKVPGMQYVNSGHQQQQQQSTTKDHRRKVVLLRPKPIPVRLQHHQRQSDNMSSISQDIESLQINSGDEKTSSPRLSAREFTHSPPSTAPLPAKFHGNKDNLLLNIRSAPNLPSQPDHPRLKDMRLPVKSLRAKESPQSSETSILEIKTRSKNFIQENNELSANRRTDKELILEFKGRPREERQRPRSLIRESRPIMEFKGRPHEAEGDLPRPRRELGLMEFKLRQTRRRVGYSSTESMATSSSGGSMESLRSSTSEGNRSTSSSESRHSTSLSSHSSDSGSTNFFNHHSHHHHHHHHHQQQQMSGFLTYHASKLHILSPISDKSSQEPASETSDNNRNNNSQKASPEEAIIETNVTVNNTNTNTNTITSNVVSPTDTTFKKRRVPQNKNLINLALQSSSSGDAEIQGSDSGISIESRAGIKCKPFAFHLLKPQLDNINLVDNEPDLSDLPFDMPKLRRRRLLMQQDATTSGSATSVDLGDLPFDMPKLRRRLRCTQSTESSASQASSSLSVRDVEPPALFGGGTARPKMTLNLDGGVCGGNVGGIEGGLQMLKKPGGLSLGLPLELATTRASADLVDVELPLERQGWYHGSITRIEAEAVLRLLREGSYLVRNSESTKQDYSLSLKSARGFMHMRIQKNDDLNAYILGQFSKPFDSIPEMVRHFSVNRLPIRGAEHMCLLHPVIAQLL